MEVDLADRVTVVHGENGQGKTNLLEAVWLLATLKPLRGARTGDLVRFGCTEAQVSGRVCEEVVTRLSVRLERGRRTARVDGKAPATVSAYAEHLKVVAFTPDDLQIAKGGPSGRRRWLDRAAFTRWASYLDAHRAYARALKARNRLLKQRGGRAELDAFDRALADRGAVLLLRRLELLDELAEEASRVYQAVTKSGLHLEVEYQTAVGGRARDRAALAEALHTLLAERRGQDLARGHTTAGPHMDDVQLTLAGHDVRGFASQGQQRAVVLALKIAEIENLRRQSGRQPVLLLDDVASELDPERNAHLLAYLTGFTGQVILTTTDPSLAPVPPGAEARWLGVRAGVVTAGPRP